MSVICPSVLAATLEDYNDQLAAIESFAERIQIDLGDGQFTTETLALDDVHWPSSITADIHLMYSRVSDALPKLIALQPSMVILHAETDEYLETAINHLHDHGIAVGIALLQATEVSTAEQLIKKAEHVLIFSGSLGSFGGKADLGLLRKVAEIRAINPDIEIGWDGGANAENARQLRDGGVDVLNVGGAIQKANRPENAYRELVRLIES